jgi:hypothetical protein
VEVSARGTSIALERTLHALISIAKHMNAAYVAKHDRVSVPVNATIIKLQVEGLRLIHPRIGYIVRRLD